MLERTCPGRKRAGPEHVSQPAEHDAREPCAPRAPASYLLGSSRGCSGCCQPPTVYVRIASPSGRSCHGRRVTYAVQLTPVVGNGPAVPSRLYHIPQVTAWSSREATL